MSKFTFPVFGSTITTMAKLNVSQLAGWMNLNAQACGLILIGPPCSGKSTMIIKLKELVNRPIYVASTDDQIDELARTLNMTYSEVFSQANHKLMKQNMSIGVECAKRDGKHVIYDQTSMGEKSRRGKLDSLRGLVRVAVNFDFDVPELLKRNQIRSATTGKHIPESVIKSMIDSYKAPTKAEGFDHVFEY